jgi:type VI secretion system secreted protein VgrG
MRTGFKQAGGLMTLSSPLGADDLLLDSMEGSEGISELFTFKLRMRSASIHLDATAVVGQDLTVALVTAGAPTRHISGMVTRFVQSGQDQDFARYDAELAPALWLLTLSRDRKIYPNQGVDAIIKQVLTAFGIRFESRLAGAYATRDYCVQYDETAFDFISRLMEQAGIFYFFIHASGSHTMVLADINGHFAECNNGGPVRFWPDTGMHKPAATVSAFSYEHCIVLKKAVVSDYDFMTPDTTLEGDHAAAAGSGAVYDFATGHVTVAAARALARLRVDASQAGAQTLRGDSYCCAFTAGARFALQGHFVPSLNSNFVLRRVHHCAQGDAYSNAFEAFPADTPFRAPVQAPRPRATGCETALVVGPDGEEIWTDQYGRIKVRFPWDRDAKDDQRAPWIRVAQAVAGKGYGALFLPRVGHEVVITYLNGDPDRPLVTGSVYNGNNSTPVALPANGTQSVLRTRSSKQGTAGNELRFEDRKDAEELTLHAQKDMLVEIENALTTTVKKGAEIHTLEEGDRTIDLKQGKESHKVAGTRSVAVTGAEDHVNQAAFTHQVKGNYALTIDGSLTIEVTGAIKLVSKAAVAFEAGAGLSAKAGTELTCDAGTNLTSKAGKSLLNQAGLQIDHKAPIINSKADATQTVEAGAMLTLKGAMAKVN